ncbi:MAG: 3-isopropylmalate dehydratase small subunit [Candidatus Freyarchaeota archaeon]|nr:3-isopropylmalate dehydratase small subunit [Candidatus Jordarchaeia archaeon]
MKVRGKAWKFGDNVDTDVVIPGRYLTLRNPDEMASHAMEVVRPEFAKNVKRGDLVVAGRNFGCGSSREEAAFVLKHLGVGAVVAESFARIFFRNAVNLGLPVVECRGVSEAVNDGDEVEVNLEEGVLRNITRSVELKCTVLPDFLMEFVRSGGAIEALKKKLKAQA